MSERLPQSVYWRRRLLVAGGAAGIALVAWFGPDALDAIEHNDNPIPAGCATRIRDGQDYWTIADAIDEQTRDETGEIAWKLGRTNPDVPAGELQPGQTIGVPEEYCHIVEQPGFNQ